MMDAETFKIAVSLGVGGVLACLMFFVYRKDAASWQESWKGQSQMLIQVVKENTAAITALTERLELRGGDRRAEDVEDVRGRRRT